MNAQFNRLHYGNYATGGLLAGLALAIWLLAAQVDSGESNSASTGSKARGADVASAHPIDKAIELGRQSAAELKEVKDYTAVFSKKEQVDKRFVEQTMEMKFREEPFSVYFRCLAGKEGGREVVFVEGENGGHLLVREKGLKSLAGTLKLKPDDPKVMQENRYVVTEVGIAKILEKALAAWDVDRKLDPEEVEVEISIAKVGSRECDVVQVRHRKQRPELPFQLSRVYFDKHTRLPLQAEQFGWGKDGEEPTLLEEYSYTELKTNVGLGNEDFDPENPKYSFGGKKS